MIPFILCLFVQAVPTSRDHQHTLSVVIGADGDAQLTENSADTTTPVTPEHHKHAGDHSSAFAQAKMEEGGFNFGKIASGFGGLVKGSQDKFKKLTGGKSITEFLQGLYAAYKFGAMDVSDIDYPFACLCDNNGFCLESTPADEEDESTRDPSKGSCPANAGRAPDPGMRDDSSFHAVKMFAAAPIVGCFLASLIKCCSGEKPDLLKKPESDD